MRTLKELAQNEGRVWLYVGNEDAMRKFVAQAKEEGFTMADGSEIPDNGCFPFAAINKDMVVNHLSMQVWVASFNGAAFLDGSPMPKKIDYMRYISDDGEYECLSSKMKYID